MTESIEEKMLLADYAFRFDALPERVTFTEANQNHGLALASPRSSRFLEFVELFAAFCGADRFSGHAAKDRDH